MAKVTNHPAKLPGGCCLFLGVCNHFAILIKVRNHDAANPICPTKVVGSVSRNAHTFRGAKLLQFGIELHHIGHDLCAGKIGGDHIRQGQQQIVDLRQIQIAGFFKKSYGGIIVGTTVGTALRYLCSLISGAVLFAEYAPEGQNPWIYSLGYNATYMLPELIICIIALAALYGGAKKLFVANKE